MGPCPIFVINLTAAGERWQRISAHLRGLALDGFQRLEAVDGRRLSSEQRDAKVDRAFFEGWYGRAPSAGEVGCTLSHLGAYETLLDGKAPFALVLEDDAELTNHVLPLLEQDALRTWLAADTPRVLLLTQADRYLARPLLELTEPYRIAVVRNAWLAHGYLINRAGARLLLRKQSPIRFLVDDWMDLNMLWGVDVRCVLPNPIHLHETAQNSSLDDGRESVRTAARPRSFQRAIRRSFRRVADALFYKLLFGIRKGESQGVSADSAE
ncbi:glycosyltransferase family 25 protein [Thauera phenolivorans]|uniref:glycosyltransferase family 25 protein n=1 Tax=Thauera phenolivorans TaxID=1792543 RepID=UPI0009F2DE5E|nr:glycosyltransferase family 25 protein [Thauera phenolivorans]